MDLVSKNSISVTPVKEQKSSSRSKNPDKPLENVNPNLSHSSSPNPKITTSPAVKSAKSQKSASKHPNLAANQSPKNRIRERRFIVAKKNAKKGAAYGSKALPCKCGEKTDANAKKCLCVAYENLRASQEEFFRSKSSGNEAVGENENSELVELGEDIEKKLMLHDLGNEDDSGGQIVEIPSAQVLDPEFCELGEVDDAPIQAGLSTVKRRREKLMEEARRSVPESGSGRVMHLVKAFENLMRIPNSKETDLKDETEEESHRKVMNWALPGLQPPKVPKETDASSSSFSPSELLLTAENLGLDSRASISSSWDGSQGSVSSRTSNGGRRSRRNSLESCSTLGRRRWKKKQVKATCQKPFNLRTEQRGKMKEEEFMKKMQEMMNEEKSLRIPIAQGLPWTTDEPECLLKPPIKENTRPVDLKLHTDLRAAERAEFDHQIAEKISLIEQYKMERERQQKMEEEEEIRRLRKELIPKAQPMPYFDRPFIPKRSSKNPTVPREPKFHIPQQKKIKCCMSWNDMSPYTFHECSSYEDVKN